MHLHFERTSLARTDCNVLSLTWMGKVPDELPDDDGWKLNRLSYYQDGWLATGNARGIVGVTFTTCYCRKTNELPLRTNYNLRGHRSEVTLVKWNEPYQKLASCDSSGIIFVWIKYEGRWSIELINDRSTKVTDFCWSHDGRMALICYQDGFVLVGSVAGQRYWSSMLNLDATITCGIWSPDDQQVLFGTSNGQILVIDVHGAMVAQVSVQEGMPIASMCWSCEKFKMEETDEEEAASDSVRQQSLNRPSVLALCFQNGTVYLMKSYDDVSPTTVLTGLKGVKMEWSNNGDILAVAGVTEESESDEHMNCVQFYTVSGSLRFVGLVPYTQSPVTALTWGHNDKRLFVATGSVIHIGWVTRRIATLQLLSRLVIHNCLKDKSNVQKLPLPRRLKAFISSLFGQTIKCYLPEPKHLRDFVSKPPTNGIRLHCTMIRHNDDVVTGNATYTLFLEYLGGLVPLLKGKRASKIRPEFIIFDPEFQSNGNKLGVFASQLNLSPPSSTHSSARVSPHPPISSSDSEVDEGCASPRLQRRKKRHRYQHVNGETRTLRQELVYLDDLPENHKLLAVSSNIWGTKFKLLGLTPWLPTSLGTITYRTSLLHLQPRQMTLVMKELNGPEVPDPSRTHHVNGSFGHISFSEDEDDPPDGEGLHWEESAPVAPMTPKKCQTVPKRQQLNGPVHRFHPAPQSNMDTGDEDCIEDLTNDNNETEPRVNPEDFLSVHHENRMGDQIVPRSCLRFTRERGDCAPSVRDSTPTYRDSSPSYRESIPSNRLEDEKQGCGESLGCVSPTSTPLGRRGREPGTPEAVPRWAEKVGDLRFIDDDVEEVEKYAVGCTQSSSTSSLLLHGHRSRSIGHLQMADFSAPVRNEARVHQSNTNSNSFRETQRRLTFASRIHNLLNGGGPAEEPDIETDHDQDLQEAAPSTHECHKLNGYVRCACAANGGAVLLNAIQMYATESVTSSSEDVTSDSQTCLLPGLVSSTCSSNGDVSNIMDHRASIPGGKEGGKKMNGHVLSGSRSIPSSPVSKRKEPGHRRGFLYSPRLARKTRRQKLIDSSDEDASLSGDDAAREGFTDLESFQKAYIRKKLKKWKGRAVADGGESSPSGSNYREFVLHNKAPLWNDVSQVYQLDFGGRVTQESAKNFQIEFRGKQTSLQVMQFGRIDGNAYTLDFQYPFCALQAFAVALANVTQRLK